MTSINLDLSSSTLNGLRWISEILGRLGVPYKIGGGFAAKAYGSPREINDIDISLPGSFFDAIVPEVAEYITAGPKHYRNEKWDCWTLSVNYKGQDIDMTDVDTLLMSNLDQSEWFKAKERRLYDAVPWTINGVEVLLMDPRDLIAYKKELGGEHQAIDIAALEEYLRKEEIAV